MQKLLPYLIKIFALAVMLLGVNVTWGQKTYKLVTSTAELSSGSKYVILSGTGATAYILSYQNTNNRPEASATVSVSSSLVNTTVATATGDTAKGYEFTLGGSSGAWSLFDPLYAGYLYAASSSSNYLRTQTTNNANGLWTITFSSNAAVITATGSTTNKIMRYNSASSLFSCYSGGQNPIYLYRETFRVTYNGNSSTGGSVPTDANNYFSGATVTAATNGTLVKSGYSFTGWNTAANGTGTSYAASSTFAMPNNALTLYAQWAANSPTLTAATLNSTLTATYGTASTTIRQATISGTNLTGNITVTPQLGYEASTSSTTNFSSSAISVASGTIVYFRFAATKAAGTYNNAVVAVLSGGGASSNVNVSTTSSTSNAVAKKALTITANDQTVSYGTPVATVTGAGSYVPTGFVNGEDESVISGSATYTTTYTTTTNAGTNVATITPVTSGLSATNYSFTPANGNISVTQDTPFLAATPTSLTGFTYINGNGPSAYQSFNVSGSVLTGAPGDITVTAPANYQVSLTTTSTDFSASVTIPYTSATLTSTPVYVRLKAGLADASYNNETINISGGGATASVTVSGNVTNQAPVASLVIISNGSPIALGTEIVGDYDYEDYEGDPQGASIYKWYTATDDQGTGATVIPGASAGAFTPTSVQLGKYIRFSVVPVAATGTTTGVETFSPWYGPVVAPLLAITGTQAHGTQCVGTAGTAIEYTITNSGTADASGVNVAVTTGSATEFAVSALSSTTIAANGGTATFLVTFTPSAGGSRSAVVTATSSTSGSNSATRSLSGTGTAIVAPAVSVTGATATFNTFTVNATATVNNCSSAITAYGIIYGTSQASVNANTGTIVAGNNSNGSGAFSVTVTGLNPSTTYYYKAFATNATGTRYSTTNAASIATPALTLAAPVATNATAIAPTSFVANWDAVANATSYNLEVYQGTETATTTTEYFETGLASAYPTTAGPYEYTLATGTWVISEGRDNASTTYLIEGNKSLQTRSASYFITPSYDKITFLSFKAKTVSASPIGLKVEKIVNGGAPVLVQNLSVSSGNPATFEVTVNETSNDVKIKVTAQITGAVAYDEVRIDHTVGSETSIANYTDITGTSQIVGLPLATLTPGTEYKYRVKAVNDAYTTTVTSSNSNPITVTTGKNLTWNGTQWTGGVTPTAADNGTVAAPYITPAAGLTIGDLTVQANASVTVPSNRTLTVARSLVNNAGVDNFHVEDNGALVQTAAGTATNTGAITVTKKSNPLYRLDYTLWSAPTTGQTLRVFSMGTSNNRFYEYISSATEITGYYPVDPLTTSFTTENRGKSFLIRMPNTITSDVTGSNGTTTPAQYVEGTGDYIFEGVFKGTPNTGNITFPLYNVGPRYTAIGNPYPSPINLADFYSTNSGVIDQGSALYFWRKRNNAAGDTGSYATLTLADFNANDTGDNDTNNTGGQNNGQYYAAGNENNWAIAPAQGFIVQTAATAPENPVITFNNDMRQAAPATGGQAFFRTGISQASRYRMRVTTPAGGASQMSVVYTPQGTLGLDYGYDGKKLGQPGLSLYTLAESTPLAIQARPEFDVTDVVPVGFTAATAGSFTIAISHTDGVFANGQKIYLKDNTEGIIRDMELGNYTFTSEAGTFEGRFEVVYTTSALGTDTPILDANTVIVYQNAGTININSGVALISSINVFDIRGRKLYAADKINATEAAINNLTAAQQVLIVEVATDKGTVTKKIVF
ncbi:beta strand repeat-containing protein [Flavobacterium sp. RHBU_24]|uniref:beta strand repeat-containing protein n=1 Tax=Flavobacterium sp. RHBU_24 TaxID=3391185 RepID=UPI0039852F91